MGAASFEVILVLKSLRFGMLLRSRRFGGLFVRVLKCNGLDELYRIHADSDGVNIAIAAYGNYVHLRIETRNACVGRFQNERSGLMGSTDSEIGAAKKIYRGYIFSKALAQRQREKAFNPLDYAAADASGNGLILPQSIGHHGRAGPLQSCRIVEQLCQTQSRAVLGEKLIAIGSHKSRIGEIRGRR